MANPNIVNVTSIFGKTATVDLNSTSNTTVVSNGAGSNTLVKINTIMVSNVDGVNDADITITYHSQDDIGGTAFPIVSTVTVPADSTLIVLDKNTALYLEEDRSLGAQAGTADDLVVLCSYEEIDDA